MSAATDVRSPLALVTGASSGIGQALALALHARGHRLALVARRGDELERWIAAQNLGLTARAYPADVRDAASVAAAAAACMQAQGLPDVVIANAGISVGVDLADPADLEVLRTTVETNLIGMAATFQPFVQPMRERGSGRLVGIASVAGIRGLPGHAAYCSSKAGAIALCESLRGDLRGSGVRVVTLVPGYVATPLTAGNRYAMPFLMSPDAFADRAARAIDAGASYRVIPWQMGVVAKLLRALPNAWLDRAFAGRPRKRRRNG